jgi:hypothetical protein
LELPNGQNAEIPQAKIRGYLLSPTHRDGQHKAEFFTRFGFSVTAWQELAAALRQHAIDHEIAKEEDSPFGKRYIVEGIIQAPDGRTPMLRTVWFIETGADTPRFVTAYPLRRTSDD